MPGLIDYAVEVLRPRNRCALWRQSIAAMNVAASSFRQVEL